MSPDDWRQKVRAALARRDHESLTTLLRDRPVEEVVSLLEDFQQHTSEVLLSVPPEDAADVLEEVDAETAREALGELPSARAADVFDELEDDHASDVVQSMEPGEAAELLDDVPPEDAADVLEIVPPDTARDVLSVMPHEIAADVLEEMTDVAASDVLERMPTQDAAKLLGELDPHEAADLLQEMEPESAQAALEEMEPDDRSGVVELLAYAEDTAGGQMTKRYFAMRASANVEAAVESLRQWEVEHGNVYYVYAVDAKGRLIGVVPLHRLVTALPETPIRELMTVDPVAVSVGVDQEELAQLFRKYRYLAMPVVDDDFRLLGIVTVDDVVEVIDEEATEDAHHMVGLPQDERVFTPVLQSVRRRLPWLYVNTLTAMVGASVVHVFEDTVKAAPTLAVLMGIIAGQGGNFGTQTLTIITRGLALGEVDRRGAIRALWKQVRVGLLAGLCVGAVVGVLGWLWQGVPMLGLIAGAAMWMNLSVAGLMGSAVPLILRSLKLDPALASSIFVTMVTDSAGFFFVLGLGTSLLRHVVL